MFHDVQLHQAKPVSSSLHIVSIVGARPQFVKLAPISRAFAASGSIRHTILHTGQHYDDNMSTVFFDELKIPKADVNLEIGSASHASQTGRMMEKLEQWFESHRPDVVLVYGDTNSTLAACLAATKIHIAVAHVEAGLRSFNRKMPEEINRVATDHCSDRLYVPTPTGMVNLHAENLAQRAIHSGDVMRDAVQHNIELALSRRTKTQKHNDNEYGLLTLHRPSNTDSDVLFSLLKVLDTQAQKTMPLIFPAHPRTRTILEKSSFSLSSAIEIVEPLAYLDMLVAVKNAGIVLTDSGGLQKEAAFLGTPCITLREETEWTETIDIGVNQLVGTDSGKLVAAVEKVASGNTGFDEQTELALDSHFGGGDAAQKITDDLLRIFR